MSYNTRRSTNVNSVYSTNVQVSPQQQQTRRIVPQTNFVSGGQIPAQNPGTAPYNSIQSQQTTQQQPKPIIKPNVVSNGSQPQPPIIQQPGQVTTEDNKEGLRKWKKGRKISNKERRERRNKRVGKFIRPKNALMVLNELCGTTQLKFDEIPQTNQKFGAVLNIEGYQYIGYGSSKNEAKQRAAENALKSYVTNKLGKLQEKLKQEKDSEEAMDTSNDNNEEEMSWCQLASFAMFKLMDTWRGEGDFVPPDITGVSQQVKKKKPRSKIQKEAKVLPSNAVEIHPVMLLLQMKPGALFEDIDVVGTPPNRTYTVKTTIDGKEFFGTGTTKKLARKMCAQQAMQILYNVQYPVVQQN